MYQRCDVNRDGEVNIADVNKIIYIMLNGSGSTKAKNTLCEDEYLRLYGEAGEDGNSVGGLLSEYLSRIQRDANNGRGFYGKDQKHVNCNLDKCDLFPLIGRDEMNSHIYLVTVTANLNGNIAEVACMGCGWDNNTIQGVAYDGYPMYNSFLNMADTMADDCDTSSTEAMTDYILNYYAFDFALRTGDYCTAWKYWNEFQGSNAGTGAGMMIGRGCGCHGSY